MEVNEAILHHVRKRTEAITKFTTLLKSMQPAQRDTARSDDASTNDAFRRLSHPPRNRILIKQTADLLSTNFGSAKALRRGQCQTAIHAHELRCSARRRADYKC